MNGSASQRISSGQRRVCWRMDRAVLRSSEKKIDRLVHRCCYSLRLQRLYLYLRRDIVRGAIQLSSAKYGLEEQQVLVRTTAS